MYLDRGTLQNVSDEPRRCAGAVIIDDNGRIFIQRRAPTQTLFPNAWDIVGGHLEPGESFHDALRREVTEETGWQLSHVLAELDEIEYVGDDGVRRQERDFLVRVDGDLRAPRLAPAEHTEWRWIGPAEIGVIGDDGHRGPGDDLAYRIVTRGFAAAREIGLS
jgi:8-oxo-dGTP pyrophosphatase MutT (NUDIX family)